MIGFVARLYGRAVNSLVKNCLTPLHTIQKSCLNFNRTIACPTFKPKSIRANMRSISICYVKMPAKKALARTLRHGLSGSAGSGEAAY
jgi:hypothetical protein